jgi:valyl-tRNA synthetase
MTQPWPVADRSKVDDAAEADVAWLQAFVLGVRQIRGEYDLSPAKPLPVLMQNASHADVDRMQRLRHFATFLARIEEPYFLEASEQSPQAAVALLGEMKVLVPLKGLIDPAAELARIGKQAARCEQDIQGLEARIGNPNFGKAPAAVQDGARAMLEQKRRELAALRQQEERVRSL